MSRDTEHGALGRRTALLIAGVGVFWIVATALGEQLGWAQRTRAFFDLAALAGFLMAFWMIYQIWRSRQKDKDER
jgi:threonine/homoserine/homoserine lactone efflux protein